MNELLHELIQELLHEAVFYYAVAFVIFWALIYRFASKPALKWIDGEIEKISAELATAHELRAEAEAALAESKGKQAKAEKEAKVIIEMAKKEAEAMRKHAETNLETILNRQQQLATERIRIAQDNAIAVVRAAAIDMAMDIARKNLSDHLSDDDAARLVEEAIAEIPALKTKKA